MGLIITILAAILAVFSVILIHEFGHFIVARGCGVKVLKFSIGFGKALWSYRAKSGTEYVIAMLPFGGYVRMLGEGDEVVNQEDKQFAYNRQPLLARMAIVLAGPITNFLLAILLFFCIYLGGVTYVIPVIGKIIPNSIAAQGGLQAGDTIVKIDHITTHSWQRVLMALVLRMGDKNNLAISVKAKNQTQITEKNLSLADWNLDPRRPDFFASLGIAPYSPIPTTVIAKILPNSPAEKAGLQQNDKIISINGATIENWLAMLNIVEKNPGKSIILGIERNKKIMQIPITVGERKVAGVAQGYLGVYSVAADWPKQMVVEKNYTVFSAWIPAIEQTWVTVSFNAIALFKMIIGKLSFRALGGPITIFQTASKASQAGWKVYLGFIAFISATLGFINVLPIPGLDGGHFLFHVIEAITRKPVPEKIQLLCIKLGLLLLITIMIFATMNDFSRLF